MIAIMADAFSMNNITDIVSPLLMNKDTKKRHIVAVGSFSNCDIGYDDKTVRNTV